MKVIRSIRALASQDLLIWRKMPMAIAGALIPPIGMAILIVMLTISVTRQPVALVNQSNGRYAAGLARLIRADDDAYMLTEATAAKAAEMLRDERVAAIITIPANFDSAVNAHAANLLLTLNNIDIDFADDIRRSVDRSVGQFDGMILGRELASDDDDAPVQRHGISEPKTAKIPGRAVGDGLTSLPNAYHIAIEERDMRVTNVDFLHYQVAPVLILLVLSVGLLGTAMLCAADVQRGTSRMLLLAPVSPITLVISRLLAGSIASVAVIVIAVVLCGLTHAIAAPIGHWPALIGLFVLTAVCASGLGAMVGTVVRGQNNIALASTVLATYLFFMGGGFTTIAFLPPWIRSLSLFDPMRYAIDGMRQALFYPGLSGVGTDLIVLAGTAVCAALVGSIVVVQSWRC